MTIDADFGRDKRRLEELPGAKKIDLVRIGEGASLKRFYRVSGDVVPPGGAETAVAILSDDLESMRRYSAMQRFLSGGGIPVPEIFVSEPALGVLLIEDLGDQHVQAMVEQLPGADRRSLYESIVALLLRLAALKPDPGCPAYWLRFDREKFMYEYHFHVRRCLIELWADMTVTRAESEELEQFFEASAVELARPPWVFAHRDFQSSNLLIDRSGKLRIIDFQDARSGPPQYDLVSLLFDSYVTIEPPDKDRLLRLYMSDCPVKDHDFERRYLLAAVQRKLHDAGAFALAAKNSKLRFLQYIPAAVEMAVDALGAFPEFVRAREIIIAKTSEAKNQRVEPHRLKKNQD